MPRSQDQPTTYLRLTSVTKVLSLGDHPSAARTKNFIPSFTVSVTEVLVIHDKHRNVYKHASITFCCFEWFSLAK